MFVVSYTLIFAFHPKLNLNVELKFASNFLLKWFNRKFKIQNMEKDQKEKVTYEAFNPIEQQKTKCVICNFPRIINAKGSSVPANEMSYTDFYIRYEHKFLRNIYSKEELEMSKELKSLGSYYEVFDRFFTIVILLESAITNRGTFSETSKEKLSNFIEEHCTGAENCHEIAGQVKKIEIKHFDPKISNFSQQHYAFIYGRLIEFPRGNIEYETVTTANFLRNVHRIIKVKTHLTGELESQRK